MTEALREGIVIERMLQISDRAIHNSDRVYKTLIANELGSKKTYIPRRCLHITQMPSLEEVAAANAREKK